MARRGRRRSFHGGDGNQRLIELKLVLAKSQGREELEPEGFHGPLLRPPLCQPATGSSESGGQRGILPGQGLDGPC